MKISSNVSRHSIDGVFLKLFDAFFVFDDNGEDVDGILSPIVAEFVSFVFDICDDDDSIIFINSSSSFKSSSLSELLLLV